MLTMTACHFNRLQIPETLHSLVKRVSHFHGQGFPAVGTLLQLRSENICKMNLVKAISIMAIIRRVWGCGVEPNSLGLLVYFIGVAISFQFYSYNCVYCWMDLDCH